jgi:hypothetical protein
MHDGEHLCFGLLRVLWCERRLSTERGRGEGEYECKG